MMDNEKLLTTVLQLLSKYLAGANAFNVPYNAFTPGFSTAHNISSYQIKQDRDNFTKPISQALYDVAGKQIYYNGLRLLGYTPEKANEMTTSDAAGPGVLKWLSSLSMEAYLGQGASRFSNAAYNRLMYATPDANIQQVRDAYKTASTTILEGIADSSIRGYTVSDALSVASQFIRQGRYDRDDTTSRAERIKKDLQDYAKGIANLKDGLQGSLEQVLDSFEKLTGSSATVTHKDRFNAITKSIYNATVFGGATPQLLQSAIATQNAYLQGLGATQATAAAMGTINANVLSQGISVEGATLDTMGEGLNRLGAQWISSGRMKELTAAYGWWADVNNKERNQTNFRQFVAQQLDGDITAERVRKYLADQNVSAEYINSARNRRNMAAPYIQTAFLKERADIYANAFEGFAKDSAGVVTEKDKFLSDDQFFEVIRDRYIKDKKMTASQATDQATKLVSQRRALYGDIMYMTDPDSGFNLIKNIEIAERQQRRQKSTDILANMLGENTTVTGFAGVLNSFIKDQKLDEFTFADILRGALGVDIDNETIKKLMSTTDKSKIEDMLVQSGLTETDIKFAVNNLTKLHSSERKIFFDTTQDERKLKDGKTYGELRKGIVSKLKTLRTGGKLDEKDRSVLKDNINKAVQEGFISDEDAYIIRRSAELGVDHGTDTAMADKLAKEYKTISYAEKRLGFTNRQQAEELSKHISAMGVFDKTSKNYKDSKDKAIAILKANDKDIKEAKQQEKESDADFNKRITKMATDKLEAMTDSPTDIVGFLENILQTLKDILIKTGT